MLDTSSITIASYSQLAIGLIDAGHEIISDGARDLRRTTGLPIEVICDTLPQEQIVDWHTGEPVSGFYNPDMFFAYLLPMHENRCAIVSNLRDGWRTLCRRIAADLRTRSYIFSYSSDPTSASYINLMMSDDFSSGIATSRTVSVVSDKRMIFFQQGDPLDFERIEHYKKRRIIDRLNKETIISYMSSAGINVNLSMSPVRATTTISLRSKY